MDKCVGGSVKVAECAFEIHEGMFESWVGAYVTFLCAFGFMGIAFASFGNAIRCAFPDAPRRLANTALMIHF